MVSFSLRQRIFYLLLQDPTSVSFHLSQFAPKEFLFSVLDFKPQALDLGRESLYAPRR